MESYDSANLDDLILHSFESYQYQGPITRPCILAPPPSKMILGPTEEMDPKLWGNLQYHIGMESIFAKLPFQEFFQLRLMCKDFNARTFDEKFLQANAYRLSKQPFFCLVHPNGMWQLFVEYDRVSNEWHQLPIPTPHGTGHDSPPKWSVGGYLVFCDHGTLFDYWIFRVFDLHTRMQYKLPPLYKYRKLGSMRLQGLVVNQVDNTFQLVIGEIGTTEMQTIRTSIYNFVTRAWNQNVQPLPFELRRLDVGLSTPQSSVCHNGNLYVSMHSVPCIMSYDLAIGVWSRFQFPGLQLCTSAIHLGCWDGHLYAISYQCDDGSGTIELYVHQLFEGTNKRWDEVCSIPLDLSKELFETNDPSPTQHEYQYRTFLKTQVQASFCDEYVLISVFLQDYFVVDSGCDGYKMWCNGTWVPRRFALLNLETQKWERLDFPVSRDRRRTEVGVEDCGFAFHERETVGRMMKEIIKTRLKWK